MAGPPFISVIVPTYNRRHLVERTIHCLLSQDFPSQDFEIIVVDDGSTDDTLAYLQSVRDRGRLRFCTQNHENPGAARNLGAQMAYGEILAFTDSDCLPEPGWLSALAAYYASEGIEIDAVGGPIHNMTQGHWLNQFQALRNSEHAVNSQSEPLYLDTANASFRREVFEALGGFSAANPWSEDVDLGFRLRKAGYHLATTSGAVVWHSGTTSLYEYLKRSTRIGRGTALLLRDYPEHFHYSSPQEATRSIKSWLSRLVHHAEQAPRPWRVPMSLFAHSIYCLAYHLAGELAFYRTYLPSQCRQYRSARLRWSRLGLYLFLEWLWHQAHMAGQFTQSLSVIIQQNAVEKVEHG